MQKSNLPATTRHSSQQQQQQQQPFYGSLIKNNHRGEPVLSQRRDLLEQPLDFYEPDVPPATQPIVSKHYRKTQWFGRLLFYRHGISSHVQPRVSKHRRKHATHLTT